MNTTAQKIADMFDNDGLRFTSLNGDDWDDVMQAHSARTRYANTERDENDETQVVEVSASDVHTGTIIRYEFKDGSALVVAGDAWDLEGETPFSWASV